jgi:hypothetical protein
MERNSGSRDCLEINGGSQKEELGEIKHCNYTCTI